MQASTAALQLDTSSLGTLTEERWFRTYLLTAGISWHWLNLASGAEGEGNTALSMASGSRPDDRRRSSSITVSGYEPAYNNFLIDGMDNNEAYIGTVVVKPSIDALAEVKVQTALPAGRDGPDVSRHDQSADQLGNEQLSHGTLFEFFRNQHLDARNFFAAWGPKPVHKQNNFGGSFGGPLKKNTRRSSLTITRAFGFGKAKPR